MRTDHKFNLDNQGSKAIKKLKTWQELEMTSLGLSP